MKRDCRNIVISNAKYIKKIIQKKILLSLFQGCRGIFNMGLPPRDKKASNTNNQDPIIKNNSKKDNSNANKKCRLLHQGDPFTKLGPFKMEVRNRGI